MKFTLLFSSSFIKELKSKKNFQNEIDALFLKYLNTGRAYKKEYKGIPLASLAGESSAFARHLVKDLFSNKYSFDIVRRKVIEMADKDRIIYILSLTDLIIHGVVAKALRRYAEPRYMENLFSYRLKIGRYDAINKVTTYIRKHRAQIRDRKSQGIFVIKKDISNYTEDIPTHESSQIWVLLVELLGKQTQDQIGNWKVLDFLKFLIRPVIADRQSYPHCNLKGVPTGSPLSNVVANLYLTKLDSELSRIQDALYVRFSDDLIFMHTDPKVIITANTLIDQHLKELELLPNKKKEKLFYMNLAGRKHESLLSAQGINQIEFLGLTINFNGTVSMPSKRIKVLLSDIHQRLCNVYENIKSEDPEKDGVALCRIANQILLPYETSAHPYIALVYESVNDRAQLKKLDLEIAQQIASIISNEKGRRAFRDISYKKIRASWGLRSIYLSKNRNSFNDKE